MKFLWVVCIICGVIGFVQGIIGVFGAVSAPQQAAGAAMGVAWAVIPYCICRAIQQMRPQEVVIKKTNDTQLSHRISLAKAGLFNARRLSLQGKRPARAVWS